MTLEELVGEVVGVDPAGLDDTSGVDTVAGWDSMTHLQVILAVEAEYGVTLSTAEIRQVRTVDAFRTLLAGRGVAT